MILKRFAARFNPLLQVHSNSTPVASFLSRGSILSKQVGFIQLTPSAETLRTAFVGTKLWTSNNFEAWVQVRLIPWRWNAMALSLNWRRRFETATRNQGFKGAAAELNISQVAIRQQDRFLDGHAKRKPFNRLLQRALLTGSKRRVCLSVVGGLALPVRSFADDRKSWTSTVEISRSTGFP